VTMTSFRGVAETVEVGVVHVLDHDDALSQGSRPGADNAAMCQAAGMSDFANAVSQQIGPKSDWTPWPGGWRNEIATALIDAIYSANASYTTKHGKGIKPLVVAWRSTSAAPVDSLKGLIDEIDGSGGPTQWMHRMNKQHAPSRRKDAPGGTTKAAAVHEAASNLLLAGVESATDLGPRHTEAKQALVKVSGVGYATVSYFFMLLGWPGVKPDRMIHTFIENATGRKMSNGDAEKLIRDTAKELKTGPVSLEHAIWSWQRNR
jgi:hypothetical protein